DFVLRADRHQHSQHSFIGASVKRAIKSSRGSRDGEIGVGLGTANGAHGIGAAILLVIRVKNKKDVQCSFQHRMGFVLELRQFEKHVEKITSVTQVVVWISIGKTETVAIGEGS